MHLDSTVRINMKRRLFIEQEDANKFFDNLIKLRDESKNETFRYRCPYAMLADAYGVSLSQAEELYLNWLDMREPQSGTPL